MANKDSVYRLFFVACVSYGNVYENLLEGLRILCQERPSEEAFSMLQVAGPNSVYGMFVIGIFRICAGDYVLGMQAIIDIWEIVDTWEEGLHIREPVVSQIVEMGTAKSCLYFSSHSYPLEDMPHCVFVGCAADEVCEECFAFWFSLIIRSLC